jgi:hypothetical protein
LNDSHSRGLFMPSRNLKWTNIVLFQLRRTVVPFYITTYYQVALYGSCSWGMIVYTCHKLRNVTNSEFLTQKCMTQTQNFNPIP